MTIQEQANEILARTTTDTDELLLRLVQDRAALLDTCKKLKAFLGVALEDKQFLRLYSVPYLNVLRSVYNDSADAIAQAERP